MNIYVLYERETGQIVHTHTEVLAEEARRSSEGDILELYRRGVEDAPADLEVLELGPEDLSGIAEPRNAYVDVAERRLSERSPENGKGGATR